MSRVSYDGNFDALANGRWERNSIAVLRSKRGKKNLTELREALLALPQPRLAYETFCKVEEGEIHACVIGAYLLYKGKTPEQLEWLNGVDMNEQADWAAVNLRATFTLIWTLIAKNDEDFGGHIETTERDPVTGYFKHKVIQYTEEQRYEMMMDFLDQILGPRP